MGPRTLVLVASDIIETGGSEVWLEDDIVHVRSTGTRSTSESVSRTFDAIQLLAGRTPRPVFFDARSWPGGETPAWITAIERLPKFFTAVAILFDEESRPEVGHYPETIDRLVIPFRMFTDRNDAFGFLSTAAEGAENQNTLDFDA